MFDRKLLPFLLFGLIALSGCATQTPSPPAATPSPPQAVPAPAEPAPYFSQSGIASFYGAAHHGKLMANGRKFDQNAFTAAHLTLAFGTVVRVTNLGNGKMVKVEIDDRGPTAKGRIIDLSAAAARALGMEEKGITRVRLEAFRDDQEASEN